MSISKSILLGMSGGTDSSMAAILLKEAGYEVVGITFRFYEHGQDTTYLSDAQHTAQLLGIRHIIYDAREAFKNTVIRYFVDTYMAGATPLPCVKCNNMLKWPLLVQQADALGITHIATGHYVRIVPHAGAPHIAVGVDQDKDQSFFLWGLSAEILQRAIFPLGNYTKLQVRQMAAERGYHRVATKRDSIGVCFCPNDYRPFLQLQLPPNALQIGNYISSKGEVMGQHRGYPNYTVGQRRGLGINAPHPLFVKSIDPKGNTVMLVPKSEMFADTIYVNDVHIIAPYALNATDTYICKIRYRKQYVLCTIEMFKNQQAIIHLLSPEHSIAPGQSAVFYLGDIVIGGGIITFCK